MKLADLDFRDHNGCLVVKASGDIDLSNAASMRDAIVAAMATESSAVVFDMSSVDYLGSAGIRLVFQLRQHVAELGKRLRLVVPDLSAAYETLRLAGVTEYVPTSADVEEALELECAA